MRLISIAAENFQSIGKRQTLQLEKRGVVRVIGANLDDATMQDNGAGKTTLLVEAPSWCLYGVTTDGRSGDDVINRFVGENCVAEFRLEDSAGVPYAVVRARKSKLWKTGVRIFRGVPHDTVLDPIKHREYDITVKSHNKREREAQILRLVGVSQTSFMNVVVFGQTDAYKYSQLRPAQRAAVFDEVLEAEKYVAGRKRAEDKLRTVTKNVERVKNIYNVLHSTIASLGNDILEYRTEQKKHAAERGRQLKDAVTRLQNLKRNFRAYKQDSKLFTEKDAKCMERLDLRLARLNREDRELRNKRMQLRAEAKPYTARAVSLHRQIEQLSKPSAVVRCKACGQKLSSHKHLAKLQKQRRQAESNCYRIDQAIISLQHKMVAVEKEHTTISDRLDAFKERRNRAQTARELCREIPALIAAARAQLSAAKQSTLPYVKQIAFVQKRLRKLRKKKLECTIRLRRLHAKIAMYKYWVDAFSPNGLRALVVENELPLLNQKAAEVSQRLSGGNIAVKFTTQKTLKDGRQAGEFGLEVLNKHGSNQLAGNSGGESGKINVCIGLAWQMFVAQRSGVKFNVAVFDEPFDKMDKVSSAYVAAYISEFARDFESVFVITHNEHLAAYFPNTIHVVKKNNQTRIKES